MTMSACQGTRGRRMWCIWVYGRDFLWFHGPSGSPPLISPKTSCWSWGLFVFAFCNEMPSGSIGCAVPTLLPVILMNMTAASLHFHSSLEDCRHPQCIFWCTEASHWPCAWKHPSSFSGSQSILMRQARLCFLHLLVVLWSFGAGGRAVGQTAVSGGGGDCSHVSLLWAGRCVKTSHGHVAERWWWGLRLRLWAG